jgi:alkyl sulfatase BDS1-like metallo-beta-lactamase superfamily hydrolase
MKHLAKLIVINALIASVFATIVAAQNIKHLHPEGKMPSKVTVELQNGLRQSLPFEDKRDFEEARRGFIAAPSYRQIMAEKGHVAWDIGNYDFLLEEGKDFDSIHPSLQRQAKLNMAYGLYDELS